MPRRPEIPAALTRGPFTTQDAEAAGLSYAQLRSACWRRIFRNVYCLAALPLTSDLRIKALRLAAPPHVVLTGMTAAWWYGVWQARPGTSVPIHTATPRLETPFHHPDVRTSRLRLDPEDITEMHGVRITTPERTCFGLMAASDLVEAVVWADAFLHAGLVTQRGLMRYADERPFWPHVRKIRLAVELSCEAAESPMETRLRMVMLARGLPMPFVNVPIYDLAGELKGRPDLHYLGPPIGMEYDGEYHFDPLLRYGAHAVYRTPDRIVSDIVAIRPDFAPLEPPRWASCAGVLLLPPPR